MANEEGWLAVMWSCDITFVENLNSEIEYVIPDEGTNLWWDAACVLSTAKYKEEAELFIDFLCRPDIAKINAEYLESTTPNKGAYELLDEDVKNNEIIYPSDEVVAKSEMFEDLADYASIYTSIWNEVLGN